MTAPDTTRREFLRWGGIAVAGVTAAACAPSASTTGTASSTAPASAPSSTSTAAASPVTPAAGATMAAATSLTVADFETLGTCQLLPEKTEGPFPLDEQFVRRDVTEGYPGHPVRLGMRVVDASCNPVPGAAVEIWHTDATGDYSAYADGGGGKDEGPGTTFCRGTQVADENGIVEFLTIYPGWYRGRCVHIHLHCFVDETQVLTSQLFFEDDYTAEVFTNFEPYTEFGLPDTLVGQDRIAGDAAAEATIVHVTPNAETTLGTGTLALINLGVDL